MAPPHRPCSKQKCDREKKNLEISILHHHHLDWGYQKLADVTGRSKSQVRNVVKRASERGYLNIGDAHRSRRPPISPHARLRIEKLIEENPGMPLRELAVQFPIEVSHMTVKRVADTADNPFILLQTRKKPWLRSTSPEKRLHFARAHQQKQEWWEKVVFHDETTYVFDPHPARDYVRIQQSELLKPILSTKLLRPTFQSGRTPIPVWAAVAYGFKSQLVRVRQRTEEERRRPKDRLGLDSHQFAEEIHSPYLIPFCRTVAQLTGISLSSVQVVGDNAGWHKGGKNRALEKEAGYQIIPWPPHPPI